MSQEMGNQSRTDAFRRNPQLETLLEQLNGLLQGCVEARLTQFDAPKMPLVLVVGGPRSGTTLMMQWLAASGLFGYPSNLIARFYKSPYVGALIHEMLLNPMYRYKNDFMDIRPYTMHSSFSSDLGKTDGLAAPNVFWYFWRRFFDFSDCPFLDENRRLAANTDGFVRELAAIESVFEKPFAMKGIIVNWNLDFISQLFKQVLFIHMRREPGYQISSILRARKRFRGDRRLWWGFKPPEYDSLSLTTPEQEVAAQIYYTRRAITSTFETLPGEQWLTVDYEAFCENPGAIYQMIRERMAMQGHAMPERYEGCASFNCSNGTFDTAIESYVRVYAGLK